MAERASYDPITPPKALADYVRLQNQRLFRLAGHVARVQRRGMRRVTASVTVEDGDDVLLVDTSGGAVDVTLPPAREHVGRHVYVKLIDDTATLTILPSGSDTIDFGASLVVTPLNASYGCVAGLVTAPATYGWVVI